MPLSIVSDSNVDFSKFIQIQKKDIPVMNHILLYVKIMMRYPGAVGRLLENACILPACRYHIDIHIQLRTFSKDI